MKRIYILVFLVVSCMSIVAQNAILKIDGSHSGWSKTDNAPSENSSENLPDNENVVFNTTSEGIYISVLRGTNKIKLYALTGQMLLNGDLKQGRFFIPAKQGIYFLRINNKSYKVICK
jgi:hypothetical protein